MEFKIIIHKDGEVTEETKELCCKDAALVYVRTRCVELRADKVTATDGGMFFCNAHLSDFKNLFDDKYKVLNITTPHLTRKERDMFTWGRIVAIHRIGGFTILEYLDRKREGARITDEIGEERMFHIAEQNRSCSSLDLALITAISIKYQGLNSDAPRLIAQMLQIPIPEYKTE